VTGYELDGQVPISGWGKNLYPQQHFRTTTGNYPHSCQKGTKGSKTAAACN